MSFLVKLARHRSLQPMWQRVREVATIGMNFWASHFAHTGERDAIAFVRRRLVDISQPVIFDVGANLGEFSEAVMQEFGGRCRIYAFEPAVTTFAALTSSDLAKSAAITFHRFGMSDGAGTAVLHSSEACSTIASVVALDRPIRPFDPALDEQIELTSIDDFCAEHQIERIDFLKLDIEGHELAALDGAKRMIAEKRISFVQFEFGENNVSARTFLADFVRVLDGYEFYRVVPGGPVAWHYNGGDSEIFATMNYLAALEASAASNHAKATA